MRPKSNPFSLDELTTRNIASFWRRVDRSGGPRACWPWRGGRSVSGYGVARYGGRERARSFLTHRVAEHLTNGPVPDDVCICHHCDNRLCCNPAHFFRGTRADNNRDRSQKGRDGYHGLPGERHHQAKLTEDEVRAIRAMYVPRKVTVVDVARAFGISRSHAHAIIVGRYWPHVH